MRLILLGPPGAGKGTQAVRLAERHSVPHVSTGDLLRFAVAWGTDIGKRAHEYMEAGELVADEIVLELLRHRLSMDDARNDGFILDGFPRNTRQAEELDKTLSDIGQSLDAVVALDVPDETIALRISGRASCSTCGRTYNLHTDPAVDGVCPRDGQPLFQRADDREDVVLRRLGIYHRETAPLIHYYEASGLLDTVMGSGSLDEVSDRIEASIRGVMERERA